MPSQLPITSAPEYLTLSSALHQDLHIQGILSRDAHWHTHKEVFFVVRGFCCLFITHDVPTAKKQNISLDKVEDPPSSHFEDDQTQQHSYTQCGGLVLILILILHTKP